MDRELGSLQHTHDPQARAGLKSESPRDVERVVFVKQPPSIVHHPWTTPAGRRAMYRVPISSFSTIAFATIGRGGCTLKPKGPGPESVRHSDARPMQTLAHLILLLDQTSTVIPVDV